MHINVLLVYYDKYNNVRKEYEKEESIKNVNKSYCQIHMHLCPSHFIWLESPCIGFHLDDR